MAYKNYSHLIVWQRAVSLVTDVYKLTERFPNSERYGISAQLRRAAVSAPANIAEGYGRATRGEYVNQLSVARGSLLELETLLIVARNLELCASDQSGRLLETTSAIQRMLARLRARLL